MATTFGVEVSSEIEPIRIAFRSRTICFTDPLAELLPDETPVIPMDNTAQGIFTIKDIKDAIKKQNGKSNKKQNGKSK